MEHINPAENRDKRYRLINQNFAELFDRPSGGGETSTPAPSSSGETRSGDITQTMAMFVFDEGTNYVEIRSSTSGATIYVIIDGLADVYSFQSNQQFRAYLTQPRVVLYTNLDSASVTCTPWNPAKKV